MIEASDSTLADGLRVKSRLHARHGVPVLWVFDLRTPMLRVLADPSGDEYVRELEIAEPGVMAVPGLDGVSVDLHQVLAPPTPPTSADDVRP